MTKLGPPLDPRDDFYRSCGVHGTNAGPVVSWVDELKLDIERHALGAICVSL